LDRKVLPGADSTERQGTTAPSSSGELVSCLNSVLLRNVESRSRNHCCSAKTESVTYMKCVFVQSACAVLYWHLWPVRLHRFFSTLSHKCHDFRKMLNIRRLIFSANSV
jgi:hypothetical protein